jgi:hypothetical protein
MKLNELSIGRMGMKKQDNRNIDYEKKAIGLALTSILNYQRKHEATGQKGLNYAQTLFYPDDWEKYQDRGKDKKVEQLINFNINKPDDIEGVRKDLLDRLEKIFREVHRRGAKEDAKGILADIVLDKIPGRLKEESNFKNYSDLISGAIIRTSLDLLYSAISLGLVVDIIYFDDGRQRLENRRWHFPVYSVPARNHEFQVLWDCVKPVDSMWTTKYVLPYGQGIAPFVLSSKKPIVVEDLTKDPRLLNKKEDARLKIHGYFIFPLTKHDGSTCRWIIGLGFPFPINAKECIPWVSECCENLNWEIVLATLDSYKYRKDNEVLRKAILGETSTSMTSLEAELEFAAKSLISIPATSFMGVGIFPVIVNEQIQDDIFKDITRKVFATADFVPDLLQKKIKKICMKTPMPEMDTENKLEAILTGAIESLGLGVPLDILSYKLGDLIGIVLSQVKFSSSDNSLKQFIESISKEADSPMMDLSSELLRIILDLELDRKRDFNESGDLQELMGNYLEEYDIGWEIPGPARDIQFQLALRGLSRISPEAVFMFRKEKYIMFTENKKPLEIGFLSSWLQSILKSILIDPMNRTLNFFTDQERDKESEFLFSAAEIYQAFQDAKIQIKTDFDSIKNIQLGIDPHLSTAIFTLERKRGMKTIDEKKIINYEVREYWNPILAATSRTLLNAWNNEIGFIGLQSRIDDIKNNLSPRCELTLGSSRQFDEMHNKDVSINLYWYQLEKIGMVKKETEKLAQKERDERDDLCLTLGKRILLLAWDRCKSELERIKYEDSLSSYVEGMTHELNHELKPLNDLKGLFVEAEIAFRDWGTKISPEMIKELNKENSSELVMSFNEDSSLIALKALAYVFLEYFRNPVTGGVNFLKRIINSLAEPDKFKSLEWITEISNKVRERTSEIISTMLYIGRGKPEVVDKTTGEPRRCNIYRFLNEIISERIGKIENVGYKTIIEIQNKDYSFPEYSFLIIMKEILRNAENRAANNTDILISANIKRDESMGGEILSISVVNEYTIANRQTSTGAGQRNIKNILGANLGMSRKDIEEKQIFHIDDTRINLTEKRLYKIIIQFPFKRYEEECKIKWKKQNAQENGHAV